MAARMGAWGSLANSNTRPYRGPSLQSFGGPAVETSVPAHPEAAPYPCLHPHQFKVVGMVSMVIHRRYLRKC
jgi:hypothetical protein